MDLGTAAHCACLEPDRLGQCVLQIPREVLSASGSRAGAAWKQYAAEHADKVLLKEDDYQAVLKIRDAVYAHPLAKLYLEAAGPVENAILWRDEASGLACRARPDKLLADMPLVVDLKTGTESGERWFTNRAIDHGYDIQAAHYSAGVELLRGECPVWAWIVVPTSPPYMPVRVFGMEHDRLEWASHKRRSALTQIVDRRVSGDWSDTDEHELKILSFPKWSYER